MNVVQTSIEGLSEVHTQPVSDHRGSFARWYCENDLATVIGSRRIVQINHSITLERGAIRGVHFQRAPHSEMKLIRCIKGRVWDVAVDLRRGSETFLRWYACELTPEAAVLFVIPEGCAHGFQVLEAGSELVYLHTAFYTPETEGGVRYDDPAVAIDWPLPVTDVSERDRKHPLIGVGYEGLET